MRFAGAGGEGDAEVDIVEAAAGWNARLVNRKAGGAFRAFVTPERMPLDLTKWPVLRMHLTRSRSARVDLYPEIAGRLFRVRVWGPGDDGPALPAADISARASARAEVEVEVNLLEAIAGYLPAGERPLLERLTVGWLGSDPLVDGGLTGNRAGERVTVRGLKFAAGPAAAGPAAAAPAPGPAPDLPAGALLAEGFERPGSEWPGFGAGQAAEAARVPREADRSDWCLRCRSAEIGSVLGLAWPVGSFAGPRVAGRELRRARARPRRLRLPAGRARPGRALRRDRERLARRRLRRSEPGVRVAGLDRGRAARRRVAQRALPPQPGDGRGGDSGRARAPRDLLRPRRE
jgi:hypothetical protein